MITIGRSWNALNRIKETVENLRYLYSLSQGETAEFDTCQFARPVSIVPLALLGHDKQIRFRKTPEYLSNIRFPQGQEISGYTTTGSTYFPLTRADLKDLDVNSQEEKLRELSDKYSLLLERNISEDKEFLERIGRNVCALLISEMTDNIDQHAKAENTFIFSQYWPTNGTCEICLADNGIGMYQSLIEAGRTVEDDLDAMQQVINDCLSAKDEFGSQKRGTGIRNTINLLANNELNGFFCIISGRTGYFVDSENNQTFMTLQHINWNGTIVNMGFKKPQTNVDIYEYIY